MPRIFPPFTILFLAAVAHGGDMPAAKLRSPVGTVLQKGAKGWTAPVLHDNVPTGVQLVTLPGARGVLEVKEGDVRLILAGNVPEMSNSPALESVVSLQKPAAGLDLEFALERGRVLVENHKENGPAKVRVHIQDKSLDFDLMDKKAVIGLELFSRWAAGAPFQKNPKADHKPVGELIFLVASGKAQIELNKEKHPLQGPVMYKFDTLRGREGPLPLAKAPAWVNPALAQPDASQKVQAAVERLRRGIADKGVASALAKARESADASDRAVAAMSGAAQDDLVVPLAGLKDKAKEVRAAAIAALVHSIGRGSAEDVKVYQALLADKLKTGPAASIMELLHGFNDEQRLRPETYETLITYLQNDQLMIRELAAMNLYALVPQGKSIAY